MTLNSLNFLPIYHKGEHKIDEEFYIPCIENSQTYDRAVGFFSSTIYSLCWLGLKNFIEKRGKMRMICSPLLNKLDIEAMEQGYEFKERITIESIRNEFNEMLKVPYLNKPAKVLASLITLGYLEIKIATLNKKTDVNIKRMFHDKVGIFKDENENKVVFKGSMNETWTGLSNDGNLESIDVYVSWDDSRDRVRVNEAQQYFERLWNNDYPLANVIDFPRVLKEEFLSSADVKNWTELVDEICSEIEIGKKLSADKKSGGRTPRPHQISAIEQWTKRGRRGIFEHATGSGKTFTALCIIRDALARGETPLIFVPSDLLLKQWIKEVRETLSDLEPKILVCGGGHIRWRQNSLLRRWTRKSEDARIVIASMSTAFREDFLNEVSSGEHILFVADEAHRLGSLQFRKIMSIESGPRIALSATPRRAGDSEGTSYIYDYFEGVVPPPYTLSDAIRDKALTPYMYYVHSIHLTETEQEVWNELSKRVRKLYAQSLNGKQDGNQVIQSRINKLLIERSRVLKGAHNKIHIAKKILIENFKDGERWIVYCDSQTQLNILLRELRNSNINALEYHTDMLGDREQTLLYFESNGGILVSIKCLDEGVDIPAVTHALILASSKNPREFIQRRGRVLRKSNNKPLAFIYDVLVKPEINEEDEFSKNIILGEMARAVEFGEGALNPSAIYELKRILLKFDLNFDHLKLKGIEEDDE